MAGSEKDHRQSVTLQRPSNSASTSRDINTASYNVKEEASLGSMHHTPAFSLPAKHQPTAPMPRALDVINGAPTSKWTPTTSTPANVNNVTDRLNRSLLLEADKHYTSSFCSGQHITADQHNGFLSHVLSVSATNKPDSESSTAHDGGLSSKRNAAKSSISQSETSESYSKQHCATLPADLDQLMEAVTWTRDDDSSGTKRVVINMVRANIETFSSLQHSDAKMRAARDERGRVVVYTTSVSAIRRRHESCARALHILHTHGVAFEARDIYISREHMEELRQRLKLPDTQPDVDVPHIFISGIYLGSIEELENFNETGDLRQMFASLEKVKVRPVCEHCSGHRYVICNGCSGSRKSKSFYKTSNVFTVLRCAQCDENGMVPCYLCNPNSRPTDRHPSAELAAASSPSAK